VASTRLADRPKIEVIDENLSDFNDTANILLYGNSGVGKTVLAAGAPNATFLTTEKGVVAAKRAGHEARVWRAPTWDYVEAGLDRADAEMGPEDWLLVDSGSKMQILLARWWLGLQNEENEARDIDIPQIQDHQKWQNMFMRFWDRIVDGPYNSIIICTAMHKEDPEGESIVLPAITGKDYTISNYCCAQMDMVLYYGVARQDDKRAPTIRRLLAETYPPWFAKDRFNVMPRWTDVEDGDYFVMEDIIADIMAVPENIRRAAKTDAA
jgi:AAA domain-containing protein